MHREENHVESTDRPDDFWLRVDDWSQLVGRHVEVGRRSAILDSGRVDAVAEDGSVLWLAQDGAVTRRLIVKQDGVHVKLLKTVGTPR